jgi:2-methylcitrate dehydratase
MEHIDPISEPIVAYAGSLRFEELPRETVATATRLLIDSLGCLLGGFHSRPAAAGRRLAEGAVPALHRGRLLGTRAFSTAEAAAFANSSAIRYLDFNDTFPGGHPSDCLGALLGLAESAGADGRRLLTALVVAYETFAQMIRATRQRPGWSQGVATGIATAAGLSSLLQLSPSAIAHALAITTAANVALGVTTTGEISEWKAGASAFAARNATFATLLAAEGVEGPARPFVGRNGFWELVSGSFTFKAFGGRGEPFILDRVRLKYWPVQYETQAAVWAARELRAQLDLDAIESIELGTYSFAARDNSPEKWEPRTRETADHSLPFVFARALLDGAIGLESFSEEALSDPRLKPLLGKTRVRVDDEIDAAHPATIQLNASVTTVDGRQVQVRSKDPRGHERNPMTDDEVSQKFLSLALPLLGQEQSDLALGAWWRCADAGDLGILMDLLAVPSS